MERLATCRRNSLYGPGLNIVNLSGSKTFSLPWEGIKMQIRADAQNAFNHPSFGVPGDANLGGSCRPRHALYERLDGHQQYNG